MRRTEPLIVGPAGAGKSTIGSRVAALLGLPFVDLDAVAGPYYHEVGQPLSEMAARVRRDGFAAAHRWWQPARLHALERVVRDHQECVFSLGAGHSHYEDDQFWARARLVLETFQYVILLLPSSDTQEAVDILRRRCEASKGHGWIRDGVDYLSLWVNSSQNRSVATVTVASSESPETIASAVADAVASK